MSDEKLIGYVGVDSGQMMLADPCYVTGDKFPDGGTFDSALPDGVADLNEMARHEAPQGLPLSYAGACVASCSQDQAAVLGWGDRTYRDAPEGAAVVCSSGIGDGVYPVYVEYSDDTEGWGRRVSSLRIDFLPHPYFDVEADDEDEDDR